MALAWLGRGTFDTRLAEYLLSLPMLGDYLEDGLADFGESISDDSEIH